MTRMTKNVDTIFRNVSLIPSWIKIIFISTREYLTFLKNAQMAMTFVVALNWRPIDGILPLFSSTLDGLSMPTAGYVDMFPPVSGTAATGMETLGRPGGERAVAMWWADRRTSFFFFSSFYPNSVLMKMFIFVWSSSFMQIELTTTDGCCFAFDEKKNGIPVPPVHVTWSTTPHMV